MDMSTSMSSDTTQMGSMVNASPMGGAPPMAGMSERGCKISMLWNWYTIDTCFFSAKWKITSNAMFAGSVLGVVALTLFVEFLRRCTKEHDKRLLAGYKQKQLLEASSELRATSTDSMISKGSVTSDKTLVLTGTNGSAKRRRKAFRPTPVQQILRTMLHTLQFALAYLIMLLAMYYNGFVLIGIVVGTFIGFFVFSWESIVVHDEEDEITPISCH